MILNATEAVYRLLLFLRKNGGIVRNRGKFWENCSQIAVFLKSTDTLNQSLQNRFLMCVMEHEFEAPRNKSDVT